MSEIKENYSTGKIEMTNKTFRLPIDLVKRLNIAAKSQGLSLNQFVVRCCDYAVNHMENVEETKN